MHSHLDFPVLGMSSQGNNPDGADAVPMQGMGATDAQIVANSLPSPAGTLKVFAIGAGLGAVVSYFLFFKNKK